MKKMVVVAACALAIALVGCGSDSTTSKQCGLGGFKCEQNKAFSCGADNKWVMAADCSKTLGTTCGCSNQGCSCVPIVPPAECGLGGFKCEANKAYTCEADKWKMTTDCSATVGTTCQCTNQGCKCEAL